MRGMHVVVEEKANALTRASDFERCLKPWRISSQVNFYTEQVRVRNAAFLDGLLGQSLCKAIHITSALAIPKPPGSVILSLTTSRTTPTRKTTSSAISANEELHRGLRASEQLNARVSKELFKMFPKAVDRFLQVHRRAAQKALA